MARRKKKKNAWEWCTDSLTSSKVNLIKKKLWLQVGDQEEEEEEVEESMSERDRSNFKLVVQKKKREKESYDYKFIKKRETDGFNLAIMMMKS